MFHRRFRLEKGSTEGEGRGAVWEGKEAHAERSAQLFNHRVSESENKSIICFNRFHDTKAMNAIWCFNAISMRFTIRLKKIECDNFLNIRCACDTTATKKKKATNGGAMMKSRFELREHHYDIEFWQERCAECIEGKCEIAMRNWARGWINAGKHLSQHLIEVFSSTPSITWNIIVACLKPLKLWFKIQLSQVCYHSSPHPCTFEPRGQLSRAVSISLFHLFSQHFFFSAPSLRA